MTINYYENGYAFTAPDEATVVTPIGAYSDLMFVVYSTQDVYVTQYLQVMDAAPGQNARTNVYIEDRNMNLEEILTVGTIPQQVVNADLGSKPFFLPKGGKFEQYYNDDFSDSVSQINMQIGYLYQEQPNNVSN